MQPQNGRRCAEHQKPDQEMHVAQNSPSGPEMQHYTGIAQAQLSRNCLRTVTASSQQHAKQGHKTLPSPTDTALLLCSIEPVA